MIGRSFAIICMHPYAINGIGSRLMNNRSGSKRWQQSAASAAQGTLTERWRWMTEQWLGARSPYQALSESATADVAALCNAAQRWHDLALRRLAFVQAWKEEPN
jgi:hypothetical protein